MNVCINIFLFVVLIVGTQCKTDDMDNAGTAGSDIDGQTLVKLGRKFNKPVLTILGMAMTNLHRCSEWTEWTECDATKANYFGTRNRTRECGVKEVNNVRTSKTNTDFMMCEGSSEVKSRGFCPEEYKLTTHGFCIKLYETKKNHDDAETECQKDGGFLINIDSDLKHADVKSILEGRSFSTINIGGRRRDSASQWEYKYGTNSGHFKWYSGYPKASTSDLCLALSILTKDNLENYLWWNLSCTIAYPFLCEIPV